MPLILWSTRYIYHNYRADYVINYIIKSFYCSSFDLVGIYKHNYNDKFYDLWFINYHFHNCYMVNLDGLNPTNSTTYSNPC